MRRQEQPLEDDNESSMTDSESEFQFSEDKGDIMVPDSQCDRPLYPGTNLTIYEYHVKVCFKAQFNKACIWRPVKS